MKISSISLLKTNTNLPIPNDDEDAPPGENGIYQLRRKISRLTHCFLNHIPAGPLRTQADILDDYFQNSFAGSITGFELDPVNNPYAIIARGNYGRKEIVSQSEINILFIFITTIPQKTNELIRDIIYPLWDIGLNITYSTRTIEECVLYAKKDYAYLLSVLDSRFVCGASLLFSQLLNTIREKIAFKHKKAITDWQFTKDRLRHENYGSDEFILEPDLFFSSGGINDYLSIISIARLNAEIIAPEELRSSEILTFEEYESLADSIGYIKKAERFLHITTSPKSRLSVRNQFDTAAFMEPEYPDEGERTNYFLGQLFSHMTNVRKLHTLFFLSVSPKSFGKKEKNKNVKSLDSNAFGFAKGLIFFKGVKKTKDNPDLLLEIFKPGNTNEIPLNAAAIRQIKKHRHLLNMPGRSLKKTIALLEKNLFQTNEASFVPFQMIDTGIIDTLIPEFTYTHTKKKAGHYHLHSLANHLLLTVINLKKLFNENQSPNIKPLLGDRVSLFWAGLLHDMQPVTIRNIMNRFEKPTDFTEAVCFLTQNHSLLYDCISRKNIYETDTIKQLVPEIKSPENLSRLYILTIADMKATGPLAFSENKLHDLSLLFEALMEAELNTDIKNKIHKPASSATQKSISEGLVNSNGRYSFCSAESYLHQKMSEKTIDGEITILSKTSEKTRQITLLSKTASCSVKEIFGILIDCNISIYDYRSCFLNSKACVHTIRIERHTDMIFENEKWGRIKKKLYSLVLNNAGKVESAVEPAIERSLEPSVEPPLGTDTTVTGDRRLVSPKVAISYSEKTKKHSLEIIGRDTASTLLNLVNFLVSRGFEVIFFRKTAVIKGSLYIFHGLDKQKKWINSEEQEKLYDNLYAIIRP
jgi:[protein-PII] uridylyltransferase